MTDTGASEAAPGVLTIKLGALGDLVQAMGPFAAIRDHHPDARRVLLTTAPFVDLARAGGWFHEVWVDTRPRPADIGGWFALRRRLRGAAFTRVYDLQTSDRSSLYYRLFWPGPYPEWSGIAGGCSHPHDNPARDRQHTLDRQAEQLGLTGIAGVPAPDLSWVNADVSTFGIESARPYAILMPGGAPHRPAKRWPAERFAGLARRLQSRGVRPVLIGAEAEAEALARIRAAVPEALDLKGRTDFLQIATLARGASVTVGNDTGPMHLAAAAGCACVVLFSGLSDPALCAPRGARVRVLRRPSLGTLGIDEVWGELRPALP